VSMAGGRCWSCGRSLGGFELPWGAWWCHCHGPWRCTAGAGGPRPVISDERLAASTASLLRDGPAFGMSRPVGVDASRAPTVASGACEGRRGDPWRVPVSECCFRSTEGGNNGTRGITCDGPFAGERGRVCAAACADVLAPGGGDGGSGRSVLSSGQSNSGPRCCFGGIDQVRIGGIETKMDGVENCC
jgi:hypothetical protein